MIRFDAVCALVEEALAGGLRRALAEAAARAPDVRAMLLPLRERFRRHDWSVAGHRLALDAAVADFDRRTRAEGLHALHDWDGRADGMNRDSIPVDVLNFVIDQRGGERPDARIAAMLVDYYFVYILALLSLRIWDSGDADANLDRLGRLLLALQGLDGSGHRFAGDAETLILIATSHYEPEERGYERLLQRVRVLDRVHRVRIAMGHAVSMGCHLRFGFQATYARDTVRMRADNAADYPWLCFSLATLMTEYAVLHDSGSSTAERDRLGEALLNGLSPDARAFVGEAPASLTACDADRVAFREAFGNCRDQLLARFERWRPSQAVYSPLSFFFNFSHNVVKGAIVDALLRGRPWAVSLNDLLTSRPREPVGGDSPLALATTLMGYARSAPDRIRGRLMPVIVYDPAAGRQAFTVTIEKLRA